MLDKKKILKASGQWVCFNPHKVQVSLERAGVQKDLADTIARTITTKIKHKQTTTQDIHTWAFHLLKKEKQQALAARFSLKKAIFAFGPTGFPFEQFIADVLRHRGFQTKTNVTVQGFCVSHEIDVIAQKFERKIFIEAKFHHRSGLKSDVKVPLYIHSRFEDIQKKQSVQERSISEQWIVTNTRFTKIAIQYALCSGLKMLAWRFPKDNGLEKLIEEEWLHPITCLTTLTHLQKQQLLDHGVVLCRDIADQKKKLHKYGLSDTDISQVIIEANAISQQSYV